MKRYKRGIVRFSSGFEITFNIYKHEYNDNNYIKYQDGYKKVVYIENEKVWRIEK